LSKNVTFHIGLGKTGSTYLQQEFFPKLQGIEYIPSRKYHKIFEILENSPDGNYFISREFDQQMESECIKIAEHYPDANIIMVLRPPASWIASQYRRFAKNGIHATFQEFFDIENDAGLWKQKEVMFSRNIEILERLFNKKPLVLFHEDLKKDPHAFLGQIAAFAGPTYDPNAISLAPVHKSHSEKRLKMMRKYGHRFLPREQKYSANYVVHKLQWRWKQIKVHTLMALSAFFPDSHFDDIELIPQDQLDKIKEVFKDDYAQCKAWAAQNNPPANPGTPSE
jgi:hypothetical protein